MEPIDPAAKPLARRQTILWVFLLLLACAIGVAMRSTHMTDIRTRTPDEYTYIFYARTLADQGLAGYARVFTAYNADPVYWEHPAPDRIFGVVLTAAAQKLTGANDARPGAAVSWVCGLLSLLLVPWIGLRYFNRSAALLSLAFFAFSFTELAIARRAWQDSLTGLMGLVTFILTCEILRTPRRKALYLAFFALAVLSLLTKEADWIAFAVCGSYLFIVTAWRERSARLPAALAAGAAASVALALVVDSLFAGGIHNLISAELHVLNGRVDSSFVFQYSGPWYQFLWLLWVVGPFTAIMAAAGVIVAALSRNHAAVLAALQTLTFVAISCFGYRLQCLRMISPADGPYCLLAGLGLSFLFTRAVSLGLPRPPALALVSAALVWAAVRDYQTFVQVVVKPDLQDLAVRMIRFVLPR